MEELRHQKTQLTQEHEAIRAQVQLLLSSLADSVKRQTAASGQLGGNLSEIRAYQLRMYDLRDGFNQHIELDERLITHLHLGGAGERLGEEHQAIRDRVSQAVHLVDKAVDHYLDQITMAEFRSALSQELAAIRVQVESHTKTEDRLFGSS